MVVSSLSVHRQCILNALPVLVYLKWINLCVSMSLILFRFFVGFFFLAFTNQCIGVQFIKTDMTYILRTMQTCFSTLTITIINFKLIFVAGLINIAGTSFYSMTTSNQTNYVRMKLDQGLLFFLSFSLSIALPFLIMYRLCVVLWFSNALPITYTIWNDILRQCDIHLNHKNSSS